MRFLLQRVSHAKVVIDGSVAGSIDAGLLVFVGLGQGDDEKIFTPAIDKMLNLRIFSDEDGKMNRSLVDAQGGLLLVSQFTLYADARKGRRPGYIGALPPADAELMMDKFVRAVRDAYTGRVETGKFGADMKVTLLNDGPVTIWLDSREMGWSA